MQQNKEMTQEELQKHCIHSLLKLQKERLKKDARKQLKNDIKTVVSFSLLCLIAVFIIAGVNS